MVAVRRQVHAALVAAAAVLLGGGTVHAAGAQAPPPEPTFTVDPTVVSEGTVITFSGTGCLDPDTGTGEDMSVFIRAERLAYPHAGDLSGSLLMFVTPAADGSWTASGTLVTRESIFGPYPDFATEAEASCFRGGSPGFGDPLFAYSPVPILYRGAAPETTPTTLGDTPSDPDDPPPVTPPPPPAPRATPVAGAATFTG